MHAKNANKKTPERNRSFLFIPHKILEIFHQKDIQKTNLSFNNSRLKSVNATFSNCLFGESPMKRSKFLQETNIHTKESQLQNVKLPAAKSWGWGQVCYFSGDLLGTFSKGPKWVSISGVLEHISHPINRVYSVYSTSVGVWEPRTRKMNGEFVILLIRHLPLKEIKIRWMSMSRKQWVHSTLQITQGSNVALILTSPSPIPNTSKDFPVFSKKHNPNLDLTKNEGCNSQQLATSVRFLGWNSRRLEAENYGLEDDWTLFQGARILRLYVNLPRCIFPALWIDGFSIWCSNSFWKRSFDLLTPSWKKRFFFHIQQPQPDVKASTFKGKKEKTRVMYHIIWLVPPAQDAIVTTRISIFLGSGIPT